MLSANSFFDLTTTQFHDLIVPEQYAWEPLNHLKKYMDTCVYPVYDHADIRAGLPLTEHVIIIGDRAIRGGDCEITFGDATKGKLQVRKAGQVLENASVIMAGAILTGKQIAIGKGVLIEAGAMIKSPAIIGDQSEVRQGAYLRGYCLAGSRCVLGHTSEVKHSILFNDAKAGHFAYLGDSILGNNVNLGAGTKFANLKFLPGNITFFHQGEKIDTSRRKLGAILGDNCQTGCNSVTSPGTLLGRSCMLLPNTTAKAGYHSNRSILR